MLYYEAFAMRVPRCTLSNPIAGGIWITHERTVVVDQIRFDTGGLMRIPLNNSPWRLCRVSAGQIEPMNSDWHQILSAPGIHVAGKRYGIYRVAVHESYFPWLHESKFSFDLDLDPTSPAAGEVSVQGLWAANRNATLRFLEDAIMAISSGRGPGLDDCYRLVLFAYRVPLEWAILRRDLIGNSQVKTKFAQGFLFIILSLIDDYDTSHALALLEQDEDELLYEFWNIHTNLTAYLPNNIAKHSDPGPRAAQNAAEFHRISLFRHLLEWAGGERDVRQHKLGLEYTANYNANVFGSMAGISGSKPFGSSYSEEMLDAITSSKIFRVHKLDVMKLSADLMAYLPIGFPDSDLALPSDILKSLRCNEVYMVRMQMAQFYHNYPSIEKPKNNVLVLLACNPVGSTIDRVLFEWAASIDGQRLFKRITKYIQDPQTKEQLMLRLAALLCYHRLLPPPNSDQLANSSYLEDFNTILNGERLSNEILVSEHMVLSILRVFYTMKHTEGMRTFLATVLCTDLPVQEPFHQYSDEYWKYRTKTEKILGHKEAFKVVMLEYERGTKTLDEDGMDLLDGEEWLDGGFEKCLRL